MNRFLTISILLLSAIFPSLAAESSRLTGPWVFTGYRSLSRQWLPDTVPTADQTLWRRLYEADRKRDQRLADSIARIQALLELSTQADSLGGPYPFDLGEALPAYERPYDFENPIGPSLPAWLHDAIQLRNIQDDFMYGLMVVHPRYIQFAEWNLPIPPTLPKEDRSFMGYLRSLNLPQVDVAEAEVTPTAPGGRINWLHTLNFALQLSQAYISQNWYQGGNDYLAFFGNFLWDVQLNQVYHPNMLFNSTLSYKLAINSTAQDTHHKYTISQELFQYNLKFGYKAAHKWFYSFTAQFKTQFLHNYEANSDNRMAAFLSPGQLNLGLGMTYNLSLIHI